MNYLTSGLVRIAGGAEATLHYLVGKVPFVTSPTTAVKLTCVGKLVNSDMTFARPELAGEEIYKFIQPALDGLSTACSQDSFCARATARSFTPIVSFCAMVAEKSSKFAVTHLKEVAGFSFLSRSVDELVRWTVKDGGKEGVGLQTLLSLGIIGLSFVPVYCCYKKWRADNDSLHIRLYPSRNNMSSYIRYSSAACIVAIGISELVKLHSRASMENSCFGQ